jgi:hypothetical protein
MTLQPPRVPSPAMEQLNGFMDDDPDAVSDIAAALMSYGMSDDTDWSRHAGEIRALVPQVTEDERVELCEAAEVCPTHRCDMQICIDDRADCAAGNA